MSAKLRNGILILVALLFLVPPLFSQTTMTASRIRWLSVEPARCNPNFGEVYYNTTTKVFKGCTALDTWTPIGGGLSNPMTTLGDLIYGGAAGAATRLAGNTTTTRKFLLSVGNGAAAAAPSLDTVTKSDVGLGNVENTALSTWAGTVNVNTLAAAAYFGAAATYDRILVSSVAKGANQFDGTVTSADLTAGRTWTLPNATGTVALTSDIPAQVYPAAGIALSTGSAWDTSITNNSGNWNTAYGWGNHASAGYITGPAGSDTQIQFNNAGAFGASANLTWNGSLNITNTGAWATGFTLTGGTAATSIAWTIANDNNYVWTQGVYGSAGGGPNNSFYIYNAALDWTPFNINPATESISFDATGDFGGALTGGAYVLSTNAATYTIESGSAKEARRGIITTQQAVVYTLGAATVNKVLSLVVPVGAYQMTVNCAGSDKFVYDNVATNTSAVMTGKGTTLTLFCAETGYWTVIYTGTVALS